MLVDDRLISVRLEKLTAIKRITKKYNIQVIEDGAGALGSHVNDKHIGLSSRFCILSFNGNKIVTTGMGGAILIKNKKITSL